MNSLYPTQSQIHRPLLIELYARNGKARPKELYDVLASYFNLTPEMRARPQNDGCNKWENDVQYARLQLVEKGLIRRPADKSEYGIWELTDLAYLHMDELNTESIIEDESAAEQMSQETLDKILNRQKEIGKVGEEIVKSVEMDELIKKGRSDLAAKVEILSETNCKLGYDIVSFDEEGNEKFIEVKSSSADSPDFYISLNELNKLKELKDKYALYLVKGIDTKKKTYSRLIKLDNANQLMESGLIDFTAIKWRATLSDKYEAGQKR